MKANAYVALIGLSLGWLGLATVAAAQATAGTDNLSPLAAQKDNENAAAPTYSSVQQLPGAVTLATLSNGLTVIVQENHVAPVATVRCFVKNTGSAFEGRYLGAGLSHVLEHVVAGGSTLQRAEKEITQIIDSFGGATNAFTSNDATTFFIDCPAKHTMTAIALVADAMQHIKFEPAEFARELKVVKRELADGEVDRSRVLWNMLDQTIYTTNPARHPVIGYLEVLDRTTNQAIIDFYHARYIPNNQTFVVVGDVSAKQVLPHVARQWAGTPRGSETFVPLPDEPPQVSPREAVREMDGKTYDMVFAWPTVKLSDPDMYALDVAASIVGEGESSRLVRRLKYDRPLALSVAAVSNTPHFVHGFFAVMAISRPEAWQPAGEEILRQVYRLRDELVSSDELAKAKKQKAAELVFGRQTVQAAADSLGRSILGTGDPLFEQAYVDEIQKVTAEQVRDAARRYLVPERLNRILIAPPGGSPQPVAEKGAAATGKIREERLPNGLRVLLKRHANLPLVTIQAYVLGGSLVDSEATAGRSSLLAQMLDKGTATHSAEQIARYFDSIGGRLSMGSGRFTVFGGATTLRDDFPQAAALLAECFTHPSFPRAEFGSVQKLALGAIARRGDEPQAEALELFYDSLPADSPYHLIQGGKTESVQRLTAEDLRAYHAKYFVPNNMLVAVFGDIDPDAALALVQQHFGKLKPNPDLKPFDFDRSNAIEATRVRHKQMGKQTGMVVLGYPAPGIRDKEEFAALTLLEAVMAGYVYPGGWLHEELRGAGLVYYVHALPIAGPVPGFFAFVAQTQPDKIAEVVARIERNVERAQAGKITPEEFRIAQQRVTALHAQEHTTIADEAREAALDDLYGLGFDYDKTFDARLEAVQREDLTRLAKKYLNQHVLVTTSPEKEAAKDDH